MRGGGRRPARWGLLEPSNRVGWTGEKGKWHQEDGSAPPVTLVRGVVGVLLVSSGAEWDLCHDPGPVRAWFQL